MMKKRSIRTGILFALLTPVLLICAENPIYAATTQTAGSATVSYHVDPAYQVTIPVDTSMQFNETETSYGNIVVEQAQIEDGKCIQVSLLSDLNLKNSNNSKAVIPYQILAQDEAGSRPFTSAQFIITSSACKIVPSPRIFPRLYISIVVSFVNELPSPSKSPATGKIAIGSMKLLPILCKTSKILSFIIISISAHIFCIM